MATLAEVAKQAGVSVGVASKILNGSVVPIQVSVGTKTRIFEAAARLNYVPDARARALRQRRSSFLGILTGGLNGVFCPQLIHHLSEGLIARGKEFLMGVHRHDQDVIRHYIQTFRSHRTFAVLTVGEEDIVSDPARRLLQEGAAECGPWFLVSFVQRTQSVPAVTIDTTWVMEELARMFGADRRTGAILVRRGPTYTSDRFAAAFTRAMQKAPAMDSDVLTEAADWQEDDRFVTATISLLRGRYAGRRVGILTETDRDAVLLSKGLLAAGVSFPGEVAVVGYGNQQAAWCATPALSTFDVMGTIPAMASRAAEILDDIVADKEWEPREYSFRPEFVVRDSFRPPTAAAD